MKAKLLALIVGLQSLWILGMVGTHEWRLRTAPTVLLETAPVDPRDLIRGDYVILNYKISRLDGNLFKPALTNELSTGTKVYVTLVKEGEFHRAASVSLEPPTSDSARVLQGQVINPWRLQFGASKAPVSVDVEYGLERYYVHEGTGQPQGKLTARISIPQSGHASIQQVFIDGKPYAEAMKTQTVHW